MYLKRLDLYGFKSFAYKVSLNFNTGITSIVGPNGSGKSNIADAIRWVMGEQSIKSLRGSKMEDVIFAGTENRKPIGFAEVSLTIDNSDGILPVDFAEVTITRRVFRSGESEYFINMTQCRLKDINELFMDTGMGKDGYSIIGQGKIDEILSTRSEDRRNIFEEASGIMKYKVRKVESERKLELTQQNLIRINDIINELENQLEPLRQQSETAQKYLRLRDKLKELEINVYIRKISRFKDKIKEYQDSCSLAVSSIKQKNDELDRINRINRENTELMSAYGQKLDISRQEFYKTEGNIEQCQSDIKLNDERINNLLQNNSRLDSELSDIEAKNQSLYEEMKSKKEKTDYLNRRHNEYSEKLSQFQCKMDGIISSLDEGERHIENLKSSVMDKMDILSDKRTQLNYINTHIEALNNRQDSIEKEVLQVVLEKDRENIKKEEVIENNSTVRQAIKQGKNKLETLYKEKSDADDRLSQYRKEQNDIKSKLQFKKSRYNILVDMEKNYEGYYRSVREILNECKKSSGFGKGIHGALVQLIEVEKKYEVSIEMALGNALQNIVTDGEDEAKRAIEYLKQKKLGRATFLPVSSIKARTFNTDTMEGIKKQKGFCGIASDLVGYLPKYKGIILNLLGRVVIVDDLEAGISISRKFGYSFRIVTVDGDVLNTGGSITGGSRDNKQTGILGRSREIIELKDEIGKLDKNEAIIQQNIIKVIDGLNRINEEIGCQQDVIRKNEILKIQNDSYIKQMDENITKYDAKIDMLKQEKNQLERQVEETNKELEKYRLELKEIENEIENTKKIIAEHQEKHKEGQTLRDELHNDITDYKISVNSITESMKSVNEAMERIENDKAILKSSIDKKQNEKDKNRQSIEVYRDKITKLSISVKAFEEEKTGKILEIDRIEEERKVLEEELKDIVCQIEEINNNIKLLQEDLNRLELKKVKVESEMEALQNRMWDEYELTYTNALELKKDIESIQKAQREINQYKNYIKNLGNINVGAIEEYIKTKERYEFMTQQRNDMEQAKEKLHKVISEMVTIMKKQFMEKFKLINKNFNLVFKELFEGGRAELILTDQDNILESGIEIEVQPPGKKLQNMRLLSGGERAFTAIALLFAILKLRPAPFCVLDEIEAALDDANVYRFSDYLRNYAQNTQFIMVTHRKGTMEGSDMLYGVTMEERGVSKIVSLAISYDIKDEFANKYDKSATRGA